MEYQFTSIQQLLELCEKYDCTMGEIMLERETQLFGTPKKEIIKKMDKALTIMEKAVEQSLASPPKTMGGLIGGEAINFQQFSTNQFNLCGDIISKAITYAMGTLEVNASMGLIVATPTAGSSGVLPGVLLSLKNAYNISRKDILHAMFTASAIGYIVSRNATVAGAEGGCQAEVGTASAMAAAAAVQIMGGTNLQGTYAASSAITQLLGLVCDPIGGLVEAPCQGRNAIGVTNSIISAQMSLANAVPKLPLDEVIAAMYKVGRSLPCELRETALGGVAACPSASVCGR